MQSRSISAAIVVALVAAAAVLFVVLRDDDGRDDGTATTTPAAGEQAKQGTAKRTEPKPKVPTIVVEGGQPAGGVRALTYTRGDQVRFDVESDIAEEVHVHGYDITKDVEPGKDVRFGFEAEIEGGFEVELEGSHTQIAELTVEPG